MRLQPNTEKQPLVINTWYLAFLLERMMCHSATIAGLQLSTKN
jgi:hypothetical protein